MSAVRTLRLVCPEFWADVRVREVAGRWLASADTPDGPSLGVGRHPIEALDELLATVPDGGPALSPWHERCGPDVHVHTQSRTG